ncbi:unnamed protein product [Effrenium voratum]|nr:unnamed protein product [Effrenium voratum]
MYSFRADAAYGTQGVMPLLQNFSSGQFSMKNSRVPRAQVGAESGPSLGTLEVGDVVTAEVKSTRDTWAELDVDGRPGRIYLADLSKTKISHPGDVVRPGETVRCFVKQFKKDFVSLTMHDTFSGRLRLSEIETGSVKEAAVTHVNPRIGAFVDFGAVTAGLVPLANFPGFTAKERARTLQQSLSVDDVVQVRVVEVDVARGQVTVRLVKPE